MARLFPKKYKYYLNVGDEKLVALTEAPKRIPGGYLTADGRRYVRSVRSVELHYNIGSVRQWFNSIPRLFGRKTRRES